MLIIAIIIALAVLWFFIKQYPVISEISDELDTQFVCPSCGHRFDIKMRSVWYQIPTYYVANGFRVKCPNCKIKDICSHPHD